VGDRVLHLYPVVDQYNDVGRQVIGGYRKHAHVAGEPGVDRKDQPE
jgi:hypothetical protein